MSAVNLHGEFATIVTTAELLTSGTSDALR